MKIALVISVVLNIGFFASWMIAAARCRAWHRLYSNSQPAQPVEY